MNNTTREVIARAVCRVAISNEGYDPDLEDLDRLVDARWDGYTEDADAVSNALTTAGYRLVKEQPS